METLSRHSAIDGTKINEDGATTTSTQPEGVIYTRDHFATEFDTQAYLSDFYTKIEDPAMQLILTFLPTIAARLPAKPRLLDFGAGPTIHVAAIFREKIEDIYLADFLPQNRAELASWKANTSTFNWTAALKMVLMREGNDWAKVPEVEKATRAKVTDIFYCNCFEDPAVTCSPNLQGNFDIITSFFTMEYCCNTHDEYKTAVRNVAKQVAPGGYFIMGGILEETWCSFGGRKFTCLYITREFMLDCLREAGLMVDDEKLYIMEVNGMFIVCAQKADVITVTATAA